MHRQLQDSDAADVAPCPWAAVVVGFGIHSGFVGFQSLVNFVAAAAALVRWLVRAAAEQPSWRCPARKVAASGKRRAVAVVRRRSKSDFVGNGLLDLASELAPADSCDAVAAEGRIAVVGQIVAVEAAALACMGPAFAVVQISPADSVPDNADAAVVVAGIVVVDEFHLPSLMVRPLWMVALRRPEMVDSCSFGWAELTGETGRLGCPERRSPDCRTM